MKPLLPILTAALLGLTFCSTSQAQNAPIKNLAPTGDLGPLVQAIESARLFPVFNIPLGSGFYDFEIKASIDNFNNQDMVYFFASLPSEAMTANPVWDASPKIFFCTPGGINPRVWHQANPTISLVTQVGGTGSQLNRVVFFPSKITGSATWMFKGNTHLVWSFIRINALGPEKDSSGHPLWTPIFPDWVSAQTSP